VKAEKEASLVRSEDDGVSALAIATHLINQEKRILEASQNSIEFYQARKFYRYIQSLIKDQSRVKSRAEKLVYESFPELLGMVKGGSISKWMVNLLTVYPSAQRVAKAQINSLAKIKGISKVRAERLKVKAQQSIAAPSTVYMEKVIQGTCGEIKRAEAEIKKNKDYLAKSYTNDDIDLLVRIKGIGDYSAIGLVMEIEDVNRYVKASSVSAYFGLYPEMKISGDGSTKPRMSKKGRASCRAILYMAAHNLVLHNPYFKAYHQRQRDKGMCYNAALGVVMNKTIRVVWGILKSRKPFDPKVDIANQKSTNRPSRTKTKPVANQEQLMEAPISARKRKKIKAMKESQEPVKVSSTRSSPSPVQT
jgi:transposase